MGFEVDIRKTLRSARRSFELRVRFQTQARRTVVFGPSGAGKSLTLKAIAGLLRPDAGRIAFDGDVVYDSAAGTDLPARQRGFGYLFQDYALFPRLDVRQNIAFALQPGWRNPPAGGAAGGAAVDACLRAFELEAVAAQRPSELSGGQRQRVALARALVRAPRALLLDEPFTALDPDLRRRLRQELDELLTRLDIPVLMITHDRDDLAWFGEETLHLRDGRIVDGASVDEVIVDGACRSGRTTAGPLADERVSDEHPTARPPADRPSPGEPPPPQAAPRLAPPADPAAADNPDGTLMKTSARNQFNGRVHAVTPGAINDEIDLELPGGLHVVATVTRESRDELGLAAGADAFALVKASSVLLMTDAGGARLSARNQFAGTVASVTPGAVNTEVVLEVRAGAADGVNIAAVITNESARALGLAPGTAATAFFKASSVIVGVRG